MNIEVSSVPIEHKPVLRNMFELYRYDLSAFDGRDLGEHGLYDYGYLDHYWTDEHRFPFLVRVNGQLAGFVLVWRVPRENHIETRMSEFFILRKYRGRGVGEAVAHEVFTRFPGVWSLSVDLRNEAGLRFWRRIVGRFTGDACSERHESTSGRVVHEFNVPAREREEAIQAP